MSFLSHEQIERMNELSLGLLEEVGLRIDHPQVAGRLLAAGCRELPKGRIAFPRQLVADCLAQCPRTVRLAGTNGQAADISAGGPTVFWPGNALYFIEDSRSRAITEDDFIKLTRVAGALDNVQAMVGPAISELLPQYRDFVACRIMAQHTGKHLRPCIYTPEGGRAICEMGEALAGPRPLREWPVISFGYTCISPLHWSETGLETFVQTSGYGAPMMINSEPTAGATSPVTLGGSLMLANAEALSGVVILQTLEPGRPCVFNLGFAHTMDMRQAIPRTGAPENGVLGAAGAEIAAFHGLPSASWMSTEAMLVDEQAAYEKMNVGLMHALAGVNIIWGIGQLESQRAMSLEQMVIDDEIAGLCLHAAREIATDDDSLAYDLIAAMAEKPDFLGHEHTLARFREELYHPELSFVGRRQAWEQAGSKTTRERAADKVSEILCAEPEPFLTDDQERELLKIEATWRERLA